MSTASTDPVKTQVAAHWDRRAAHFDEDFGHSIGSPADLAAWDRILDLVIPPGGPHDGPFDALDVGSGTGFLALELAARGHRATGIDFAPAMVATAREKAAAQGLGAHFDEGDAEHLPYPNGSFDLVLSRHVLWTLPHPEAALDEWLRVLRPGGRLVIIDGAQYNDATAPPQRENARTSPEYAAISGQLPFYGGGARGEIEGLLRGRGLGKVSSDKLEGPIAAPVIKLSETRKTAPPRARQSA